MATAVELIDSSVNRADNAFQDAQSFIEDLRNAADTEFFVDVPYVINSGDITINKQSFGEPSSPSTSISPSDASLPTLASTTISSMPDYVVPDFLSVAPSLSFPDRPSAELPAAPGDAPELNSPVLPDAPEIDLPSVPVLTELSIPDPPTQTMPTFDAVAPEYLPTAPTTDFAWSENRYTSDLLTAALDLLQSDIENGGYGLDPRDEQALWERTRDREQANASGALPELERSVAARGFSIPPGALLAATQKAIQSSRAQLSTLQRDISLKRADLYVQNRQFALTTGLNSEQYLMQYHAGVEERALNASKYVVEAGISLYNARVQEFNLRLDTYKTEASVFETKIRAVLSSAEIYKSQIEAARTRNQLNQGLVDLYRAQIDGANALIGIYRTRMDAANVQSQVERLKLQAYGDKVQAYAARVRAKSDEFSMFESAIRGEVARIDAYSSEVKAFSERVNAVRLQADISSKRIDSEVSAAKVRLDEFSADLRKYETALQRNTESAKIVMQKYSIDVDKWSKNNTISRDWEALRLNAWTATTDSFYKGVSFNLQNAKAEMEAAVESANITLKAADAGTRVASSLVASAQSSINAIASISE